jgi:hypothetical protein
MRMLVAAIIAIGVLTIGALATIGAGSSVPSLRTHGPITKAEATAYAHAVNLGVADVPGMVSVSLEEEEKVKRTEVEFARCAGAVNPNRRVVAINSPHFRSGSGPQFEEVTSHVEVMPGAELAARDLAAIHTPLARACLARSGQRQFAKGFANGARVGRIAVLAMPDPLPYAHSFALRLVIPLTFKRAGLPLHTRLYEDELGFVAGPVEISLTAIAFSRPGASATEQRLLSLLHGRAKG